MDFGSHFGRFLEQFWCILRPMLEDAKFIWRGEGVRLCGLFCIWVAMKFNRLGSLSLDYNCLANRDWPFGPLCTCAGIVRLPPISWIHIRFVMILVFDSYASVQHHLDFQEIWTGLANHLLERRPDEPKCYMKIMKTPPRDEFGTNFDGFWKPCGRIF